MTEMHEGDWGMYDDVNKAASDNITDSTSENFLALTLARLVIQKTPFASDKMAEVIATAYRLVGRRVATSTAKLTPDAVVEAMSSIDDGEIAKAAMQDLGYPLGTKTAELLDDPVIDVEARPSSNSGDPTSL